MNPTTQPPDTLGALLDAGRERLREHSESARLDAELLLTRVTGASRAVIYANPDKEIGPSEIVAYRQLLEARAAGQPVAYLTGEREFCSLSFEVNEHTLIPRPETEYLVEAALKRLQADKPADVIELGTGSGAIAAALATERSGWNITATDVDPQTLARSSHQSLRSDHQQPALCVNESARADRCRDRIRTPACVIQRCGRTRCDSCHHRCGNRLP
jgi:release factor glutamine methyltransferase